MFPHHCWDLFKAGSSICSSFNRICV